MAGLYGSHPVSCLAPCQSFGGVQIRAFRVRQRDWQNTTNRAPSTRAAAMRRGGETARLERALFCAHGREVAERWHPECQDEGVRKCELQSWMGRPSLPVSRS